MNTKTDKQTADQRKIVSRGKIAMAVLAVIGTNCPDNYDDVDEHPAASIW